MHVRTVAALFLAAWFVLACLLGPLIGRLLRRQQPTNTPPKGGNHS